MESKTRLSAKANLNSTRSLKSKSSLKTGAASSASPLNDAPSVRNTGPLHIVITGQTPAQKNGKNIGVNRHTGRTFFTSNKIVKDWQVSAARQLQAYRGQADGKVTIAYQFYVKDNRGRDLDNMVCTINDALVRAGLLKSDSWQYLAIGAADAELDRENPRAEIWLDE